jgi:maleate isomerase
VPLAATVEMAMHVAEPALVARSAIDVLAVSPLVTAYACTSGSFIHGLAGEQALIEEAGAPAAVTTSGARLVAFAAPGDHPGRGGHAHRGPHRRAARVPG